MTQPIRIWQTRTAERQPLSPLRKSESLEPLHSEAKSPAATPAPWPGRLEYGLDSYSIEPPSAAEDVPHDRNPTDVERTNHTGLPSSLLDRMESFFEADFSTIRLRRDSATAAGLGALACTDGREIHLAPGQYAPHTDFGRRLLAHELAHVVQQRETRVPVTHQLGSLAVNHDPALEGQADRASEQFAWGGTPSTHPAPACEAVGTPVLQCWWEYDHENMTARWLGRGDPTTPPQEGYTVEQAGLVPMNPDIGRRRGGGGGFARERGTPTSTLFDVGGGRRVQRTPQPAAFEDPQTTETRSYYNGAVQITNTNVEPQPVGAPLPANPFAPRQFTRAVLPEESTATVVTPENTARFQGHRAEFPDQRQVVGQPAAEEMEQGGLGATAEPPHHMHLQRFLFGGIDGENPQEQRNMAPGMAGANQTHRVLEDVVRDASDEFGLAIPSTQLHGQVDGTSIHSQLTYGHHSPFDPDFALTHTVDLLNSQFPRHGDFEHVNEYAQAAMHAMNLVAMCEGDFDSLLEMVGDEDSANQIWERAMRHYHGDQFGDDEEDDDEGHARNDDEDVEMT